MPSPSLVLLRTQSDARLVALAREGHERAFEAIVERYRRQLLRACRRVLPEARAEDALQQALMAAWHGLRRGDDVRELRSWLHRIAHNTSLNVLRQSGYDYEQLQDSLRIADAPDDELERRAVMRHTLAGLAALPERQREALLAIAVEGRSQDDVAGELGLSTGAVRQLVHRARSSLRAAATAVVPLPVMSWVAAWGPRGELTARIAELSAGAGSAGAATALAKAGTLAVIAGGAAAGPALVPKRTEGPQPPATAIAAPRGDREAARSAAPQASASRPATPTLPAVTTPAPAGGSERRTARTTPQSEAGERDDADDHRGSIRSGPSPPERDDSTGRDDHEREDGSGPSGEEPDRSSRSGGGDDEAEFERDQRSGPSLRTGSSGPGGGDDAEEPELSAPSPEPPGEEPSGDSSGPGSGGETTATTTDP
jgi:RNA polymerase sigma factor (sigma-70 family)